MNPHQRKQLEAYLRSMPKAEQDALFKRAAEQRREAQKNQKSERKRFEDLDAPRPGSTKRKADPVRLIALKLLAQDLAREGGPGKRGKGKGDADGGHAAETHEGVVVAVTKRKCTVRPSAAFDLSNPDRPTAEEEWGGDVACRLPAELAGRQQSELCVGDRVRYSVHDDSRTGEPEIDHVMQRDTVLARRDPHTGERRAIVANVDAVVVVVSVVAPPLHPRLIDRYLIAIEDSWVERVSGGGSHADDPDPAQAIVAVNKADLLDGLSPEERGAELAKLEPYRALGLPVIECSATRAEGLDELRHALSGKTVAFVGHSGVGKSSLTNALDPRLGIRVGAVGELTQRGRHTTTSSQLHEIAPASPDDRPFFVIDTPGIRFFTLDDMTPVELRDSFPEIRALRRGCKFNDCTHTHEPGCAVRGNIHPARYDAYLRLLDEIETGSSKPPPERIRPNAKDPRPGDQFEDES
ncbi:MAG: ribosome small subunit-dependent GTPase A [Phycisphaerales bacterium JB040]